MTKVDRNAIVAFAFRAICRSEMDKDVGEDCAGTRSEEDEEDKGQCTSATSLAMEGAVAEGAATKGSLSRGEAGERGMA